jgi:ribonuclease G
LSNTNIKKQIIINADEYETRVATVENGTLVDLLMERPETQRMLGDIYKGRVKNIHKGMQAAFIDIGTGTDAFLHIGDTEDLIQQQTVASSSLVDTIKGIVGLKPEQQTEFKLVPGGGRERKIEEILKSDQEVLVQIVKEPIGTKGPRVTTKLSIAGRYTVFVPYDNYVGISKKIEDKKERSRLRGIIEKIKDGDYGIIVRTEGEGKEEKDFAADIKELKHLWKGNERKARVFKRPGVIHKDLGITLSFIRDSFNDEIDQIVIDSRDVHKAVVSYLKGHSPHLLNRIIQYKDNEPIFKKYEIEEEVDKMLKRKVWFKGGG